jgi:hypothetical protein
MWEAYKTFQDACVGSDKLIQHTFAILGIVVGRKEDPTFVIGNLASEMPKPEFNGLSSFGCVRPLMRGDLRLGV